MKLWQTLSELVLPRFCVHCKKEGTYLCERCREMIRIPTTFRCPLCDTQSDGGQPCANHKNAAIDRLIAVGFYHDKILRGAIHRLKYRFTKELARDLSALLSTRALRWHTLLPQNPIIIPLPLHPRRERLRGFNQSLLLAEGFAKAVRIPVTQHILLRETNTSPQALLAPKERRTNLTDTFVVANPSVVRDRSIILIDDVATTGTTLELSARALKNAGAKNVTGLVLARG